MEDICQAKYFSKYHYSPPTTIKACKFLIGEFSGFDLKYVYVSVISFFFLVFCSFLLSSSKINE